MRPVARDRDKSRHHPESLLVISTPRSTSARRLPEGQPGPGSPPDGDHRFVLEKKDGIGDTAIRARRDGIGLNLDGASIGNPAKELGSQTIYSGRHVFPHIVHSSTRCPPARNGAGKATLAARRSAIITRGKSNCHGKERTMARRKKRTRAGSRISRPRERTKSGIRKRLRGMLTIQRAWVVLSLAVAFAMLLALLAPLLLR